MSRSRLTWDPPLIDGDWRERQPDAGAVRMILDQFKTILATASDLKRSHNSRRRKPPQPLLCRSRVSTRPYLIRAIHLALRRWVVYRLAAIGYSRVSLRDERDESLRELGLESGSLTHMISHRENPAFRHRSLPVPHR